MTNYEKIKNMSVDEMIKVIMKYNIYGLFDRICEYECKTNKGDEYKCPYEEIDEIPCEKCVCKWLKSECENNG